MNKSRAELMSSRRDVNETINRSAQIEQAVKTNCDGIEEIKSKHDDSSQQIWECIESSRDAILARCSDHHLVPSEMVTELKRLSDLCQDLLSGTQSSSERPAFSTPSISHDQFLHTFRFREMDDREDSIPEAHAKTFEWILEHTSPQTEDEGSQRTKTTERKKLQRELETTLNGLDIDILNNPELLSFKHLEQSPTAHLQEWLAAGAGVL